jgi:hypothetical protein
MRISLEEAIGIAVGLMAFELASRRRRCTVATEKR